MRTDTGQVFRLEDYRPSDYLIPATRLTFRLSPDGTAVLADLTVRRRQGVAPGAPLVLDGEGLTAGSVRIDGAEPRQADVRATPDQLVILRPPAAETFRLTIETTVSPASNEALMGLYRSNGVYCTQCEAEGFRRITYFLDRPDILSVYTVRIEADVTAEPGVFHPFVTQMTVQDATGGVQVFDTALLAIARGDQVEIVGDLEQFSGMTELSLAEKVGNVGATVTYDLPLRPASAASDDLARMSVPAADTLDDSVPILCKDISKASGAEQ